MKTLWYIAVKELRLIAKDRMAAVWMIFLPLGLTAIMGLVFGGFGGHSETVVIDLPVVNKDGGMLADEVVRDLSEAEGLTVETTHDEKSARTLVADGARPGALIIPTGFGGAVTAGQFAELELVVAPGAQTSAMLEAMVRGVTGGLSSVQTTVDVAVREVRRATGDSPIDVEGVVKRASAMAKERLENPLVDARITSVGGGEEQREFSIFDQLVPGYAVMFAMFTVLSAATGIVEEKERGTFRRLLVAPIARWSLLGGKLLSQFVIGVVQIGLMLLFGALVFGADTGNSLLGLLLITLATCWATTSLGILLVAVVRSRKQIHPITTLVILGTSAIGGSWYPLFLMPAGVRKVARVTLVAWSMEGYNRLMILGGSLRDVWLDVVVLLIYGAICFAIGLRLFRFKDA
jgi:ABC-2 type transport system permease protein